MGFGGLHFFGCMHQRRGVMAAIRGDGFTFAGCHEAAVVWLQVLPPTRGLTARASSGRAALVLRESFRQCLTEHIGVDNSRTRLGASWGLLLTRDLLLADLDVARVLLCGRLFLGSFLRGHLFLGGLFPMFGISLIIIFTWGKLKKLKFSNQPNTSNG